RQENNRPENRHQSGLQARLQTNTSATSGEVTPEPKQGKTGERTNVKYTPIQVYIKFLGVYNNA
ncbi:MAG: hypothetical protein QG667_1489, partial [Pseudomonadota bacterium]|nr:hypothetical protein [Pseudomonadota bacterium]